MYKVHSMNCHILWQPISSPTDASPIHKKINNEN